MLNFRVDLRAIDATPTHAWLIPTRLGAVAAVRELRVARRPREEALAFRAAVAEEREAEAVVVRDDAGHDEEDEQRQQKDARARHLVEPARAHGARRGDEQGPKKVPAAAAPERVDRFTGQAKTVLILSRSASAVSQTQNKKLSNKIEGRDRAISTRVCRKTVNPN